MDYIYYEGRFFINPLIGCNGRCNYCYLNSQLKNKYKVRLNRFSIEDILSRIKEDKNFLCGKKGSIISIGSYCDIFPFEYDKKKLNHSISWILKSLKLGNPVQFISKNTIPRQLIKNISESIVYENQLLVSTTITSFSKHELLEKNTATPYQRLENLKVYSEFGIPTNVMIKPFIASITDRDIKEFINSFKSYNVKNCVIGDLYMTDFNIEKSLSYNRENRKVSSVLDCTQNKLFETIKFDFKNDFANKLKLSGANIFLKSSCVNSNILGVRNLSHKYNLENRYCTECGLCKDNLYLKSKEEFRTI